MMILPERISADPRFAPLQKMAVYTEEDCLSRPASQVTKLLSAPPWRVVHMYVCTYIRPDRLVYLTLWKVAVAGAGAVAMLSRQHLIRQRSNITRLHILRLLSFVEQTRHRLVIDNIYLDSSCHGCCVGAVRAGSDDRASESR